MWKTKSITCTKQIKISEYQWVNDISICIKYPKPHALICELGDKRKDWNFVCKIKSRKGDSSTEPNIISLVNEQQLCFSHPS